MIAALFAVSLSLSSLPPEVRQCVAAAESGSDVAAACSVERPNLWGPSGALVGACLEVPAAAKRLARYTASFADQPRMVAGVRAAFEQSVQACSAQAATPASAPLATDTPRLWSK